MPLFQRTNDNSPIVFDCCEISAVERAKITELVEKNGGGVGVCTEPMKFMPRSKYKPGMYLNLQVYDIRYITTCVKEGKLVSLSSFRLSPKKSSDRCQQSVFLTGECMFKSILRELQLPEDNTPPNNKADEPYEPLESRIRRLARVGVSQNARSCFNESQSVVANVFARRLRANNDAASTVIRKRSIASIPRKEIKPEPIVSQLSYETAHSVLSDLETRSTRSPREKTSDRKHPIRSVSRARTKPEAVSRSCGEPARSSDVETKSTESPDSTVSETVDHEEFPANESQTIHTRVNVEFLSDDSQESLNRRVLASPHENAARSVVTIEKERKTSWLLPSSLGATTSERISMKTGGKGGSRRIAASSLSETPRVARSPGGEKMKKCLIVRTKSPGKRDEWILPHDGPENSQNHAACENSEEDDVEASLIKLFLEPDPTETSEKTDTSLKKAPSVDFDKRIDEVAATEISETSATLKTPEPRNDEHESHDDTEIGPDDSRETLDGLLTTLNGDYVEKSSETSGKRGETSGTAPSPKIAQSPSPRSTASKKRTKRSVVSPRAKRTREDESSRPIDDEGMAKPRSSNINSSAEKSADEEDERPRVDEADSTDSSLIEVSSSDDNEDDIAVGGSPQRRKANRSSKSHEQALRYHKMWRDKLNEGVPRVPGALRNLRFAASERKTMVEFLCSLGDIETVQPKGLKVWSFMLKQGILAHRTAKSLQNHFTKNILPHIEDYFDGMTEAQKAGFLKIRDSSRA